jgi:curved DNA-binding protein CbpA
MIKIPLKGNVKDIPLPRFLANLNSNRETGTLVLTTPVFTKKVYFVKGDVIFASSTYEDDRLGEMLIKAGKITMEQYDESVKLLKRSGKRQGAILVNLGYLTPKDLFWGVKYQVVEIIYSLFQLEDSEYEFITGEIPNDEVITLKMSIGNLIYEGVKRIDNWTRIRKEMPNINSAFKLSSDPAKLFQDLELTPSDRKMLSLIDGRKTIKTLIDNAWIGSFEGMKILFVLWSIGIIEETKKGAGKILEVDGQMPLEEILKPLSEDEHAFLLKVDELYARLHKLSPSQLLGVENISDTETIRKMYYKLTKEFHPDRYFESPDPSLKDKLTAIFDALTRAYTLLTDTTKKEVKGKEIAAAAKGEENFKDGVQAFKNNRFKEAVDFFRLAAKSDPGNARYWSYLSLSLCKMPNMLKDAESALREAMRLEPKNADHYTNLGMIYLIQDKKKMAHDQYKKALTIDPKNIKAKKGIEKLKG